jgi:hypothetical protein
MKTKYLGTLLFSLLAAALFQNGLAQNLNLPKIDLPRIDPPKIELPPVTIKLDPNNPLNPRESGCSIFQSW